MGVDIENILYLNWPIGKWPIKHNLKNARAKFRRNHQHKMGSLGGIMLDHQHQHGQHPHLLLQMATTLGGNGTSVPIPTIDSNGGFQENSLMMIGGGGGGEMVRKWNGMPWANGRKIARLWALLLCMYAYYLHFMYSLINNNNSRQRKWRRPQP